MNAILVRLDHLGDILLCTPLIRSLAKTGHRVEVVVPQAFTQVFDNSPFVARVHGMEAVCPGFPGHWLRFSRWLRQQHADALLLPNARTPGLIWASALSGIPNRLAMWGGIGGRLTGHRCLRSELRDRPRHFAEIMMDLARALGVTEHDGLKPDIFPPPRVADAMARRLATRFPGAKLVGIHPGSGGNACTLKPAEYGRLAELLLRRDDLALLITGTAGESALTASWPASVTSSPRVWNTMGVWNLHELAVLIQSLAVYVVPSTGPLHLASWAGTPTVSAFCAAPGRGDAVWGNTSGAGIAVSPPESHCRAFVKTHEGDCHFENHVTAERLAKAVFAVLDETRAARGRS